MAEKPQGEIEVDVNLASPKTLEQLHDVSHLLAELRDAADRAVRAINHVLLKWEQEKADV